jgi:hypothetical protein
VCGQPHDRRRIKRAGKIAGGGDGLVESFSGFVVGDEDQGWRWRRLNEEGEVKRACGEGQTCDAAASDAGLEVAPDAIVGVGELEVREEFANKGKDHAEFKFTRVEFVPTNGSST